jgi:phage terminase large subunit
VLSSERDGIYFNQAEECELSDWETLLTRTTGRSGYLRDDAGQPYGLLFGDCNPSAPTHWIWTRQLSGKLAFFESRHIDNPVLYDPATGAITPEGVRTLAQLDRLTGYRRLRLRDGLWVQAEGIIFDTWSDDQNVTEQAEYVPDAGPVYMSVDDGYSAGSATDTRGVDPHTGTFVADAHPRAVLLAQMKPDGHLDVFYELCHCLKLSDDHLREVLAAGYPRPEFAAHGPGQAEIRGRLMHAGIAPRHCQAKVDESIKAMQSWVAADPNGWRRIRVHPRCRHLRSEMLAYAYDPANPGKPLKAFDHSVDALRYLTWVMRWQR